MGAVGRWSQGAGSAAGVPRRSPTKSIAGGTLAYKQENMD